MRKFVEITVQFKFVWALFFSAAILLYSVVSMALGHSSVEFIIIWQLVALTMIITFYHYLFFGELILKSLSTKNKVIVHSLLCYATLLPSIYLFNWFDITSLKWFSVFTVSYVGLYLSCIFSFYIYYKATGEELNNRLTAYKEKKGNN
jgi:hypothetical protein